MPSSPQEGLWVGIVADGNRRDEIAQLGHDLAVSQLSPEQLYNAYKRGGDAIKRVIEVARDNAVGLITAWAWSTKNMEKRSEKERTAVFRVVREFVEDLEKNWVDLPENQDVRLVHLGRRERILQVDTGLIEAIDRVYKHTQNRLGMVVGLCLDYGGLDEAARARELWKQAGFDGPYEQHLDLPRQGVPYRALDLRIRTGEDTRAKHMNAYMAPYEGEETRDIFRAAMLPQYTPALFREDLAEYDGTPQRRGK